MEETRIIHWSSVWQFALSVIAILIYTNLAFFFTAFGLMWRLDPSLLPGNSASLFLLAAGMATSVALMVPSAGYALLNITGREPILKGLQVPTRFLRLTILMFALPFILFAGNQVSQNQQLAWVLLPPLHVLAVGIPIAWLVHLGGRGLSAGSPQRKWGIFASGLTLAPALILLTEIVVFLVFLILVSVYFTIRPGVGSEVEILIQRLSLAPPTSNVIRRILGPYLLQPGVAYIVLVFGAVIIPLIEEFLKPVGVWFLAGEDLSPGAGFAAGLLSAAGYALIESLVIASFLTDWGLVAAARIGTGVVHLLTGGITGWGLAISWREGRYLQLGIVYLLAVSIHGLWNGLTLLASGAQFLPPAASDIELVYNLTGTAPLGLGILAVATFITLLLINHALRRAEISNLQAGSPETVL